MCKRIDGINPLLGVGSDHYDPDGHRDHPRQRTTTYLSIIDEKPEIHVMWTLRQEEEDNNFKIFALRENERCTRVVV